MIDNDCKPVGLAPLYKAAAYLGALCCRFVHIKREAAFRELWYVVVGINHLQTHVSIDSYSLIIHIIFVVEKAKKEAKHI